MKFPRYTHIVRYYLPAGVIVGAAAMLLLPGDENARPSVESAAAVAPQRPSYLVAVPEPPVDAVTTASVARDPAAASLSVGTAGEASGSDVATATDPEADQFPMDVAPEAEAGLAVVPAFGAGAQTARIATDVNMRAGPSTSTQTLMVLKGGDEVAVIETNKGWVSVVLADGRSGWVYSRYVDGAAAVAAAPTLAAPAAETQTAVTVAPPAADAPVVSGGAVRLAGDVALRDAPGTGAQRMFRLNAGEQVVIAEERGEWVRVSTGSGPSGWVRRSDLVR